MQDFWSSDCNVAPEECVGWIRLFPRHYKDQSFEPAAAIKMDDLRRRTLSVVRLNWSCIFELNKQVVEPAAMRGTPDCPTAMGRAFVQDIQKVLDDANKPAFVVLPEGMLEFPSHAHVGFATTASLANYKAKRIELVNVLMLTQPDHCMPSVETSCTFARTTVSSHPISSLHRNV